MKHLPPDHNLSACAVNIFAQVLLVRKREKAKQGAPSKDSQTMHSNSQREKKGEEKQFA